MSFLHIVKWFSPLRNAENIKQRWTNLARGSFQGESNMKIFSNYFWRCLFDRFISDNILYRPSSSSRVQSLHKSDTISTWLTKPPTYFHYTSINIYKIPYVLTSVQVSLGFPVALNWTLALLFVTVVCFCCSPVLLCIISVPTTCLCSILC